jgi:hypothetical protein
MTKPLTMMPDLQIKKVSTVLHDMLRIHVVGANQDVHEVLLPEKHKKLRIRFKWTDMGESLVLRADLQ